MPDLMDRLYCSEQIHIPPAFPFIMKLYCKAAIRTQPYDLLKWSAAYFRALANGEEPPVKDRIEYPPYDSPTGLTPGYIKILIKQLGKDPEAVVSAGTVFAKWNCACLEDELLVKLVALLGARTSFNWLKFVAIAAGFISNSLTNTMVLLCELLTDEPEGGMATIPLGLFCDLYTFLAELECGPLTEEERKRIDSMESVEDASVVADKIRSAVYEASAEGEYAAEEGPVVEVRSEGPLEFAVAPEEGGRMGEEGEDKAPASEAVPAEVKELEEIPGEMSDEGESSSKEDEPFKEGRKHMVRRRRKRSTWKKNQKRNRKKLPSTQD
ncbi:UNVERIFIED_CONTAM: hypothetical protein PYX00_002539 [Menopon gallinae]|uniref:Ropporin-1-like protein n=1 Tax=Menopon gallinae TaxID=328185 RepID=A0AAW2IJ43_9NEOP